MSATILHGDCIAMMRELPDASIDAIVTDPPYELGFMGKHWDASGVAYNVATWAAAFRVLKPGGHLLAFGGTRTYHRMACAVEDAGFEIRDQLQWLYGSGFPKSLDVSKAIDKARNDDIRPVCRFLRSAIDGSDWTATTLAAHFGFHPRMVEHWAARDTDSQPAVPKWDQWCELKALLSLADDMDAEVWRLNGRKGKPGDAWHEREVIVQDIRYRASDSWEANGRGMLGRGVQTFSITTPATPDAERWQGWGTALKPANEPIVLARKPLSERTVAANVLRHGTGALHVDACRIPGAVPRTVQGKSSQQGQIYGADQRVLREFIPNTSGRWPANVILSHSLFCTDDACDPSCPVALLDRQSGASTSRIGKPRRSGTPGNGYGMVHTGSEYSDAGGASRFFYVAKASRKERRTSTHPTVKPVALMRYLIRLIAPPGGVVLDPFAGSGTTGEAALLEGVDCVLIEREAEYIADIRARLESVAPIETAAD